MKQTVKPAKKTLKKSIKNKTLKNGVAKNGVKNGNLGVNDMPNPERFLAFQHAIDRYEPKIKTKRSPVFATCVPYLTNTGLSMDWCRSYKGLQGLLGSSSVEVMVPNEDVANA